MKNWVLILKEDESDEELDLLNEETIESQTKVIETLLKYVIVAVRLYFTL